MTAEQAMLELWGALCPDCGPADYEFMVKTWTNDPPKDVVSGVIRALKGLKFQINDTRLWDSWAHARRDLERIAEEVGMCAQRLKPAAAPTPPLVEPTERFTCQGCGFVSNSSSVMSHHVIGCDKAPRPAPAALVVEKGVSFSSKDLDLLITGDLIGRAIAKGDERWRKAIINANYANQAVRIGDVNDYIADEILRELQAVLSRLAAASSTK